MSIPNTLPPPLFNILSNFTNVNEEICQFSSNGSATNDSDDDEVGILNISSIQNLPDSPNRLLRGTKARDSFINSIKEYYDISYEPNSVKFHIALYSEIGGDKVSTGYYDKLILLFLEAIHKPTDGPIPRPIVNMSHLIEIGKNGFHYCKSDNQNYAKLFKRITSTNGVFQASFQYDSAGKVKESTFFPERFIPSVDNLLEVIQNAEVLTMKENRALCTCEDLPFKIEMYRTHSTVNSAFPIFYYADYEENATYPIIAGQEALTSEQILQAAVTARSNSYTGREDPVRYKIASNANGNDLIMDLARYLNLSAHTPEGAVTLQRGVFIRINKSTLNTAINLRPSISEKC